MRKIMKNRSRKTGLPPGTPVYVGEQQTGTPQITLIRYHATWYEEKPVQSLDEVIPVGEPDKFIWLNIDGIHQVEVLERLGSAYGLHSLVLEDIVNTDQRSKVEDYDHYLYIVGKMLQYDEQKKEIQSEQVSFVLGDHYLLTFQEKKGDVFHLIRERLRNNKGRVRGMNSDYLAYTLLDAMVDHYFIILEKVGDRIEELEEELINHPSPETLKSLHHLKREVLFLRKAVYPLREVVNSLERGDSSLIQESTRLFLRDLYDHTIQVMDTIETFRDILSGMLDIYLSSISNRMNQVMKVLTIIATIFIPLTFVVGIYGMNFDHMPELHYRWSYPVVLLLMFLIALLMLLFFKKKRWI